MFAKNNDKSKQKVQQDIEKMWRLWITHTHTLNFMDIIRALKCKFQNNIVYDFNKIYIKKKK